MYDTTLLITQRREQLDLPLAKRLMARRAERQVSVRIMQILRIRKVDFQHVAGSRIRCYRHYVETRDIFDLSKIGIGQG